jgi:hypothetical protein
MTFSICYLIGSVAHALLDLDTTLELTPDLLRIDIKLDL